MRESYRRAENTGAIISVILRIRYKVNNLFLYVYNYTSTSFVLQEFLLGKSFEYLNIFYFIFFKRNNNNNLRLLHIISADGNQHTYTKYCYSIDDQRMEIHPSV
jgi:hypothetical protein